MKKTIVILLFTFFGLSSITQAQVVKKAAKGVKTGAKAVGNKTAELATKGKAKVTDKESAEWVGPEGQKIYVDDGSKYYWINEKGGRVFVTKDQLKAKVKEE